MAQNFVFKMLSDYYYFDASRDIFYGVFLRLVNVMSKNLKTKVPAYWTEHWLDTGRPTGAWWAAESKPVKDFLVNSGFFIVYHPAQEIEESLLPVVTERVNGFVKSIKEIDLSKFVPIGTKLSWKQRFKGIV